MIPDELLATLSLNVPSLTYEDFLRIKEGMNEGGSLQTLSSEWPEGPLRESLRNPSKWLNSGEETLHWCQQNEVQVLHPFHFEYPRAFLKLQRPPIFLSLRGSCVWKTAGPGLSVVGSREVSTAAVEWMEEHIRDVVRRRRIPLISGAARGVDQKAHAVALRSETPTVAFLPSGLGCVYPADFSSWIRPILESGGAVMSEFSPHEPMRKFHFQRRNRLIAALGSLLLVVQARRRSGSYMTARLAIECGTPLAVVPGSPWDAGMLGTLDLLFDGAFPVRDSADLLTLLDLTATHCAD